MPPFNGHSLKEVHIKVTVGLFILAAKMVLLIIIKMIRYKKALKVTESGDKTSFFENYLRDRMSWGEIKQAFWGNYLRSNCLCVPKVVNVNGKRVDVNYLTEDNLV